MRGVLLATVAAGALAGGLSACTAPVGHNDLAAAPPSVVAPAATPTPTPTPSLAQRLPLSGSFVTQGAPTTGTVSVREEADGRITFAFAGFSTEGSADLRIWLNLGPLAQDADGYYYADSSVQYEVRGTVDATLRDQTFEVPAEAASFLPADVQSLTVYDYANRTALGSADLS
jgi:hypothetical protein